MKRHSFKRASPRDPLLWGVSLNGNRLIFQQKLTWVTFVDFSKLFSTLMKKGYEEIVFDLSSVISAFPNGMVPMISVVEKQRKNGLQVKIIPPSKSDVNYLFEKNGWYHFLSPTEHPATGLSARRRYGLHPFSSDQELNDTVNYLVASVLQSANLAEGLPQAFEWIANELAGNVLVHAEVKHGWIQAVTYPEHQRLSLVVCDSGIGIPRSMRATFSDLPTDLEALELSVKGQVTSKPEFGQGNGLAGSIAIVINGAGTLSLTSGKARLVIMEKRVQPKSWYPSFDGTMIDLQLNTDQPIILEQSLWGHKPINLFETHFQDDKGDLQFGLKDYETSFGNRITGQRIRNMIENMLRNNIESSVSVDFLNVAVISSSFADECFGKLAVKMGLLQFGRRIKITNANALCYTIIERIVEQRISYKYTSSIDDVEFGADEEENRNSPSE